MIENEITLLKRDNENQALKLREADWQIIKNIMKSTSIFKVNSYDREVIQRDLIGMAQELKLRDSSLDEVIGDDVKDFANEIINSSSGPCIREIWLNFLEMLSRYFLFFFTAIAIGGYGNLSSWLGNPVILYPFYTITVLIAFVTEGIITPLFITEKGFKKNLPWLISMLLFASVTALLYFLSDNLGTREVQVEPTIVVSGLGFITAKYLNVKNIHRLAKGKKNFIDDLK
ncbi:hypothetical protein [Anaerosolibacter sp.]|uniref:hypothetical protein n=1 Tax=Anaerosolibacter sp. TaxID=1872527 RepID=UPI0039EF0F32